MFSWLGVTPYLTAEVIEATLRTIGHCEAGSEVVFSYFVEDSLLDDNAKRFHEIFSPLAVASGEPVQAGWSVAAIEGLIERCDLELADHPTRHDLIARYFRDRSDRLVPYCVETLVAARVP